MRFFVVVLFLFQYFIVPCGKLTLPNPSKAQQPQEQLYPVIPIGHVCCIFLCPNNSIAACVWDFQRAYRC